MKRRPFLATLFGALCAPFLPTPKVVDEGFGDGSWVGLEPFVTLPTHEPIIELVAVEPYLYALTGDGCWRIDSFGRCELVSRTIVPLEVSRARRG